MEETGKRNSRGISGNTLKIIACTAMLIDHIGAAIIEMGLLGMGDNPDPAVILSTPYGQKWFLIDWVMRMIGRIAFPIFCFLLVEGFLHTRNVKKYILRVGAFALISEIPFNLAFRDSVFAPEYQNVYVTLLLGLLVLTALKQFEDCGWKKAVSIAAGCGLAVLFRTDYDAFGVAFIVLLYLLRDKKVWQTAAGCIACAWELTAPLAFIPIRLYRGERGKLRLKYFFYWFYPVHILILYLLRCLIVR